MNEQYLYESTLDVLFSHAYVKIGKDGQDNFGFVNKPCWEIFRLSPLS